MNSRSKCRPDIDTAAAKDRGIAVTNTYYLARLMRSTNPADKAVIERVGVVFPNQNSWGTHVNIAGGAMARHAKHPQNAHAFIDFYLRAENAALACLAATFTLIEQSRPNASLMRSIESIVWFRMKWVRSSIRPSSIARSVCTPTRIRSFWVAS